MLLETNLTDQSNGLTLIFFVVFWVGLCVGYLAIVYFLFHPRKRKLILTWTTELESFARSRSIIHNPNRDEDILLVKNEIS